jgi:LuxR family maltose regulon positive regulatory protein
MPKTATHVLTWNPEQDCYVLYEHAHGNTPLLQGEGDAWYAWLAAHTSFSFRGKSGQ